MKILKINEFLITFNYIIFYYLLFIIKSFFIIFFSFLKDFWKPNVGLENFTFIFYFSSLCHVLFFWFSKSGEKWFITQACKLERQKAKTLSAFIRWGRP